MIAKFTDVFSDETKHGKKIQTSDYLKLGKYPIIDQGQDQIAGYTNEKDGVFTEVPAIIFGDHTRIIKYIDTPFFLGADGVKLLKCKIHSADYKYLYYYLQSIKIPNTGYNRHFKWLKESNILLPSLDKQHQIAAVLDKVSDLIAKRRQQLDKLDEMVKAKFVEMFGEPGEDKNNWGINCLGDVCEINPKKSLDKRLVNDFIVSFIPMPAVTENGEIDPSESKTYDEVRTGFTYFVENDVLFAKITPCMENGKGAIAKGLYNGVGFGSTEFHVLRPIKDKTTAPWLYVLTSLPKFRLDAADNMTGSAGQRRVPASFLTTYKVAAPPIELQEQFSTLYNQISKSKLTIQRSCDKLEVLKKALMQRYFG